MGEVWDGEDLGGSIPGQGYSVQWSLVEFTSWLKGRSMVKQGSVRSRVGGEWWGLAQRTYRTEP